MYDPRECALEGCSTSFEPSVWNQRYCSPQHKRDQENSNRRAYVSDLADAIAPLYTEDSQPDNESIIEYLRKENQRLGRATDKLKNSVADYSDVVYKAAYEALSQINLKPIKPPNNKSNSKKTAEVANPILSDFQCGKVTPSYNSNICRERISLYGDKVLDLTEVQRSDHPVNVAHVHMLGDMVEGEGIFPTQSHLLDTSLYKQVINVVEITVDFLRKMLSTFDHVHVVGVQGNHGALNRRVYNPETNMDRMAYKFCQMIFETEPRISFNIPEGHGESSFYAIDDIGEYSVLLMHGDQFSSPTNIGSYHRKILGWQTSGIPERFDDVMIGHWHQNTKASMGQTVLRIAGSPESTNLYAQERLGVMSRPSQHLQYIHPINGFVTAEYDCWLD